MTDAVAGAARAAAGFFADEYGPGLPAEVEAELAARGQDDRRLRQFDAALLVSVAALIVATAQFAQSIYAMQCQQAVQPTAEAIARGTRVELRHWGVTLNDQTLRITDVIAAEITRQDLPSTTLS